MNFLSHYYFDRHSTDSYHITGTVLPDLLKNADKNINIHPEKLILHSKPLVKAMMQGWKKHLDVDKHFHSSQFFSHHSHQLKRALTPVIQGSPVKPFFLGHIALELLLDNLLLTTGKVQADNFYNHLDACDYETIIIFLNYSRLADTSKFLSYFTDFKRHRYLHTYAETAKVAYALKRVCMRIWQNPFTAVQEEGMTEVLLAYRNELLPVFTEIFDEIESYLD